MERVSMPGFVSPMSLLPGVHETIECGLLQDGPDACAGDATVVRETSPPYGESLPGGYRKRRPEDYDRGLCLASSR